MAAKSRYIKSRNPINRKILMQRGIIIREKRLLEMNYSFLNCTIQNKILIIKGQFQPTDISSVYFYKIKYDGEYSPKVYIEEPLIDYNDEIHMYPSDNRLCLYYPQDMPWNARLHHLFDTIIPWTHEWIIFYEKYLISGRWEHPFVPHLRREDML